MFFDAVVDLDFGEVLGLVGDVGFSMGDCWRLAVARVAFPLKEGTIIAAPSRPAFRGAFGEALLLLLLLLVLLLLSTDGEGTTNFR